MNLYTSMPWEALCAEVAKLQVDPPVKDEAEAMQKAVGADLEPASLTTNLTTVLTTVPEDEAGTGEKCRGKPEIRLVRSHNRIPVPEASSSVTRCTPWRARRCGFVSDAGARLRRIA
jgi:hypothetical protein